VPLKSGVEIRRIIMTHTRKFIGLACALVSTFFTLPTHAQFSSGSSGSDGSLAPTIDTVLQIPANGIFNFTTINIPVGVTVSFAKNASNTPVYMLATGNVTIAGRIDVSGQASSNFGSGIIGDHSAPGSGGPGGFDGGRGGMAETNQQGGYGLGPGGGVAFPCDVKTYFGGGGGGYSETTQRDVNSRGGSSYGSNSLVPLIGGSGGGGACGGVSASSGNGGGGGGGGGAILIAASGAVNITGAIVARGGDSGGNTDRFTGASGGGGSGGAIRVVASSITGNGAMDVNGGSYGRAESTGYGGARGRVSTEIITTPGTLTLTGLPSLTIASVGGVAAPAMPTGKGDVALAADAANPITVLFTTTGVPTGGTISLTMTPARGSETTVTSTLITGSLTSGTASASINIPSGVSTLFASSSFTLSVAMGDSLSKFAMGERVEKIRLTAAPGEMGKAMLVTVSGKQYAASDAALRLAAFGGF
jgi:hypothetical protein